MTRFLVDVNVVFALLHDAHPHCKLAGDWIESVGDPGSVFICRIVQMGVLRLLTRPSIMGDYVLSGTQAWETVAKLLEDDRFVFAEEPGSLEQSWSEICKSLPTGAAAETDAYLAAFASAGDYRLVTLNKGMGRFPGVRPLLLVAVSN